MATLHQIAWGRLILGGVLGFVIAGALMAVVGPLLVMRVTGGGSYQIRSDAMAPALLTGDWVLAKPLLPGHVPARGTIVAYEHPQQRGLVNIMRVMGLPGEQVQMRGGALYINAGRAQMERLEDRVVEKRPPGPRQAVPPCLNEPVRLGGECRQEVWRETLPDGTTNLVLNAQNSVGKMLVARGASLDDTTVIRVPDGHVFVLGDNRDSAVDSRSPSHGPVPLRNLRHRVWLIHTSLDRSARFFTPRWDRFFREVR